MNPLEQNPRARRIVYQGFWVLALVVGATQVGFAAAEASSPTWLIVVLSMLPFVGAAIGYTAQVNVTAAPIMAQREQVIIVKEGTKRFDERGAYDSSSLLLALACIVIIAVGLVWLVRAF